MKLVRYGKPGEEKPGILDAAGKIRDLSGVVPDIAGAALTPAGHSVIAELGRALKPERILVSPGPCSPREAGLSNDVIKTFANEGVPIFGVCLGHQCIGHTFGAQVVVNYRMMHGKVSPIKHNGKDLFDGMPNPFSATRYHSLVIKRDTLPDCLEITAETEEGEIMGVKHKTLPIWGVQFHPESILTENGRTILKNFLKLK